MQILERVPVCYAKCGGTVKRRIEIKGLPRVVLMHVDYATSSDGRLIPAKEASLDLIPGKAVQLMLLADQSLSQFEMGPVIGHKGNKATEGHYVCHVTRGDKFVHVDNGVVGNPQGSYPHTTFRPRIIMLLTAGVGEGRRQAAPRMLDFGNTHPQA